MTDSVRSSSALRASVRTILFLVLTVGLLVPYLVAYPVGRDSRRRVARLWFQGCCAIVGLELRVVGEPARTRPVMLVANHVSYLDVPVLAALVDGTFVAKQEVSTWPVFGFLARLARTVFVDRRPRAIRGQIAEVIERLRSRDAVFLFPEGTSSDGQRVLPFKSGLFRIAYPGFPNPQPMVQPVSITYGAGQEYAWYGTMTLVPHLWQVFSLPGTVVHLRFHEPVLPSIFPTRKALARYCEGSVGRGLRPVMINAPVVSEQNDAPVAAVS